MVVAQSGMMGQHAIAVDASYLADSVVMLRYFEYAGKVKKAISVLKKRSGLHEESIRELSFDASGIHLSEPLDLSPRRADRRADRSRARRSPKCEVGPGTANGG